VRNGNMSLAQLKTEQVEEVLHKVKSDLQAKEVLHIIMGLTPEASVSLRASAGSPNPKHQQQMISHLNRKMSKYEAALSNRKRHLRSSIDVLRKAIKNYLLTSNE
jgi:hypothetical protein